jgi:hypothetical protein
MDQLGETTHGHCVNLMDDGHWQMTRHPTVRSQGNLLKTGLSAIVEIMLRRVGFTIRMTLILIYMNVYT